MTRAVQRQATGTGSYADLSWRSAAVAVIACAAVGFGVGAAYLSSEGGVGDDRASPSSTALGDLAAPEQSRPVAQTAAASTGAEQRAPAPETNGDRAAAPSPADFFARSIGGPFRLVDQFGRERTEKDPDGRAQLIFFGFARCEAMCLATLPEVAATVDLLSETGHVVRPVMITIDPEGDTPEALREPMAALHPEMLGLTGTRRDVDAARKAFQVSAERLGETPDGVPIYAHGLYIYLMDADGAFLTLMPPILGPEKMAEVVRGYL